MSGINTDGILVVMGILTGIAAALVTMVVFVVLKFMKVVTWSWLWVTSPGWITLAILVVGYIILFFMYGKRG